MNKQKIYDLVHFIVEDKAQGNSFQEMNVCMKLMLKGIPAKKILEGKLYPEDEAMEDKIILAAEEMNVVLPNLTF